MKPPLGSNALHKAALAGSIRTMERLLNEGSFPVDAWDADGCTALMHACEQWDENSVEFLLAAGADASWRRADGETALGIAVDMGNEDMVRRMLATPGGRRAIQFGNGGGRGAFTPSPLNTAASHGNAAMVRLLLAAGAHVEGSKDDNWTPLMVASMHGYPEVAAALLDAGAALEATDGQGGTALYLAAQEGQADMVRFLAERGAKVSVVDEEGMTPLHSAAIFTTDWSFDMCVTSVDFDANPPHKGFFIPEKGQRLATIRTLLELGDSPHALDSEGHTPLHYAAMRGDAEAVALLLAAGAEADAISPVNGTTPLMCAARNGHLPTVELLLSHGADPHRRCPKYHGGSLLHLAARSENDKLVNRLMKLGLSPDAEDDNGRSVLHVAAGHLPLACFKRLSASSTTTEPPCDNIGRTLLHQATFNAEADTVKYLLKRGADPRATDANGDQPLDFAAHHDVPESVRLLLAAGADANHADGEGRPPLSHAVYGKSCDNLRLLLAAGARVNAQESENLFTALHLAALLYEKENDAEKVELLLAAGADIHLRDSEGRTALHLAAGDSGKAGIIRLLLAHGADLHATDHEGRTALTTAVEAHHPEAVTALLEAGASPNTPDASGTLPLHLAVEEAEPRCLLTLLQAGADINAADISTGETALLHALRMNRRAAVIALLACRADAAPADHEGQTALHEAVKEKHFDLIPALLRAGGNPNAPDHQGRTPLDLARSLKMRHLLGGE